MEVVGRCCVTVTATATVTSTTIAPHALAPQSHCCYPIQYCSSHSLPWEGFVPGCRGRHDDVSQVVKGVYLMLPLCLCAESALSRVLLSVGNNLNAFTQSAHVEVQERATFAQNLLVALGVPVTPVSTPEMEQKKRDAEEAAMLALLEGDDGSAAAGSTEVTPTIHAPSFPPWFFGFVIIVHLVFVTVRLLFSSWFPCHRILCARTAVTSIAVVCRCGQPSAAACDGAGEERPRCRCVSASHAVRGAAEGRQVLCSEEGAGAR